MCLSHEQYDAAHSEPEQHDAAWSLSGRYGMESEPPVMARSELERHDMACSEPDRHDISLLCTSPAG